VNSDGSVLTKLFFGLVDLTDEVDETLAGFGHSLLRPVRELELTHGPRLAVLHHQQQQPHQRLIIIGLAVKVEKFIPEFENVQESSRNKKA